MSKQDKCKEHIDCLIHDIWLNCELPKGHKGGHWHHVMEET